MYVFETCLHVFMICMYVCMCNQLIYTPPLSGHVPTAPSSFSDAATPSGGHGGMYVYVQTHTLCDLILLSFMRPCCCLWYMCWNVLTFEWECHAVMVSSCPVPATVSIALANGGLLVSSARSCFNSPCKWWSPHVQCLQLFQ